MELTGSQIVIECLKEQGVDTVFGYPGGTVLPLYDALYDVQNEIRHILTAHEQGASHAADGYARSTGKVGVCISTSGPGATNMVTGIATAFMDSVPLIAITANVPHSLIGRDSFQEVSITNITMPITKHNFIVRKIEELANIFREAFYIAQEGRPGPVLIDIPKDILISSAWFETEEPEPIEPVTTRLRDQQYQKAELMLARAEKPLIMVGGGVIRGNASRQLRDFAEKLDAPVVSTLMGLGAYPSTGERYLGMLGMHGSKVANTSTYACDLLIAVGARFSDRVISHAPSFASNASIIHIDVDPAETNKNVKDNVAVTGDVRVILDHLNDYLERNPLSHAAWMRQTAEQKAKYPLDAAKASKRSREILETLSRLTDEANSYYLTEVGQHQMWAAQYLKHELLRHFITSGGLGTMGFGLGASIGTQVAHPDALVVDIAGDGCFRMNCNELGTIAKYGLPIVVLLFNNHTLGMVREWQTLFYDKRYSNTTLDFPVNWMEIAHGFGVEGLRMGSQDNAETVLRDALALRKPVVVECEIPIDDMVYPIVPGGKGIHQMMGDE